MRVGGSKARKNMIGVGDELCFLVDETFTYHTYVMIKLDNYFIFCWINVRDRDNILLNKCERPWQYFVTL